MLNEEATKTVTDQTVKIVPENRRDKVYCSFTKLVPIGEVREHPKNPNYHDREQIEILANAIKATGWRTPIGISKRSGFIIRGHGRFAAAKALGLTEVPVDYQDYDSESQELADLLADNKIADLGQIDFESISSVLRCIPPDQQLFSGFRDFEIAPLLMAEWKKPALADMPESIFTYKFSVNEQQNEAVRTAIKIVQSKSAATLTDGQCLEILANHYLGKTIKEESVSAASVKLSEDIPKPIKIRPPVTVSVQTKLVNTVNAPRIFKVDYVASTAWKEEDRTVIKSQAGDRYFSIDPIIIASARAAKEGSYEVKVVVDEKEGDLWIVSLEKIVEEKVNAQA